MRSFTLESNPLLPSKAILDGRGFYYRGTVVIAL